ncbi:hypothetical protein PLESTM_000965400 [Pleodorina starrii]|nr:hypothetical protein PLESTM_000965400 [Pleodorina starrii]
MFCRAASLPPPLPPHRISPTGQDASTAAPPAPQRLQQLLQLPSVVARRHLTSPHLTSHHLTSRLSHAYIRVPAGVQRREHGASYGTETGPAQPTRPSPPHTNTRARTHHDNNHDNRDET